MSDTVKVNPVLCQKGGSMHPSALGKTVFFVKGQQVEFWEDPRYPFGTTVSDMESYCTRGKWDLLFNAVVITCLASLQQDEDDDSPDLQRMRWYFAGDALESRNH